MLLLGAFSLPPNEQAATDNAFVGRVQAAASDSTKPLLLAPIVVSAKRTPRPGDAAWIPTSARFLYPDDGAKPLLADLRITSPHPASADLRLHGLPVDQTARDYIWGHRIGGSSTAIFGTRTKINPDVVQVALHPFLMSHQYRDTNGSLDLLPTLRSAHAHALSLASDAIERRATVSMARGDDASSAQMHVVTSVRQSDVAPPLKSAVPVLKIIPRYLDSQTHARLRKGNQTIEAFALFGREKGDWRETTDGREDAVFENTRQNLGIVRWEALLPHDSRLTAGASWEGDHVNSEHRYGEFVERTRAASRIVNPRITFSALREACTVWVSEFLVKSDSSGTAWSTSMDAGAEGRATVGWLTVQPSLAVQHFRSEATILHGVTATVRPGAVSMRAGYGTYADYFVFRNGVFENVFDPGAAQRPQSAVHYVGSIQYEPKRRWPFDLLRVTGVRKDLLVDLWGARNGIRVLSWDCLVAKSGSPGWEVAYIANEAHRGDGPLVGLIPFSLRSGVSWGLRHNLNMAAEGNYRGGSIAENRAPGPRQGEHFRLDPSYYVNVAMTQSLSILNRPASVTLTVFNALALAGSRAEVTVDQYGRRYDAPCWANIRLRYELW